MLIDTITTAPFARLLRDAEGAAGGGASTTEGTTEGATEGDAGEGAGQGTPQEGANLLLTGKQPEPNETTPEGGTAEGQDNADDKGGENAEGGDATVPDDYSFEDLSLPDGMELDTAMVEAASPVFKDLGLTQEQASKIAQVYADAKTQEMAAQKEAIDKVLGEWRTASESDPEIGGDKWQNTLAISNAAVSEFASPEFVSEVLVGMGLANHPEMIRLFHTVASKIGDDSFVPGQNSNQGETIPAEQRWYGTTTPATKQR